MGTLEGVEGQYITESKHDREPLLQQKTGVNPSINQQPDSGRDINEEEDYETQTKDDKPMQTTPSVAMNRLPKSKMKQGRIRLPNNNTTTPNY